MIWALHGAVGMAVDWREFSQALGDKGMMTRRVDLWRFLACCPMPISEFGEALNGEVKEDDPILLGYSMGGRLALHALLDAPQKWSKAIIVSAHTGLGSEGERNARMGHDASWAAKALSGDWGEFLDAWQGQGVLEGDSLLPDRLALESRRKLVARSFIDWSTGAQEDLLPQLEQIECPVLWVTGERDVKFCHVGEKGVAALPDAKHIVVPGCGHRVPWEKPQEFVDLVADFIGG